MFTVLRSNGWFSTLRLPAGFRYRIKGAAPENPAISAALPPAPGTLSPQKLSGFAPSRETATIMQFAQLSPPRVRLVRLSLIVLAAIGVVAGWFFWLSLE